MLTTDVSVVEGELGYDVVVTCQDKTLLTGTVRYGKFESRLRQIQDSVTFIGRKSEKSLAEFFARQPTPTVDELHDEAAKISS